MVKSLQHYKMFGELPQTNGRLALQILDLIREKKFQEARKLWISEEPDYKNLLISIYDNLTPCELYKWVEIIAEANYRMVIGAFPEISFASALKSMSE